LIDASPDNLEIVLNEDGSSTITVPGQASDSTTLAVDITDVATINAAIAEVRSTAQSIGSNASAIDIREDFTQDLVNSLQEGEAKLLNTDLNEEAANALSLQTRGALATAATKIASQSEQSILQLF
jgi:flagellin